MEGFWTWGKRFRVSGLGKGKFTFFRGRDVPCVPGYRVWCVRAFLWVNGEEYPMQDARCRRQEAGGRREKGEGCWMSLESTNQQPEQTHDPRASPLVAGRPDRMPTTEEYRHFLWRSQQKNDRDASAGGSWNQSDREGGGYIGHDPFSIPRMGPAVGRIRQIPSTSTERRRRCLSKSCW